MEGQQDKCQLGGWKRQTEGKEEGGAGLPVNGSCLPHDKERSQACLDWMPHFQRLPFGPNHRTYLDGVHQTSSSI